MVCKCQTSLCGLALAAALQPHARRPCPLALGDFVSVDGSQLTSQTCLAAFLWLVTVPSNKVASKAEQQRVLPEDGSIIVKDDGEKWEAVIPLLHSTDAPYDLKVVRGMIDAGSGQAELD